MYNPHPVLPGTALWASYIPYYYTLKFYFLCTVIPLRPEVSSLVESDSHSANRAGSGSNDPVPVYYPGNEITGFMARRGDFAVVGYCTMYM